MFFTLSDVTLLAKRVKLTPRAISEELRGWHWNEPPLLHSSSTYLGVSDLTNGYCETGRFAYLKHKGVKPEAIKGANDLHYVYAEAVQGVKRLIYEEGDRVTGGRLQTLMTDEFYRVVRNVVDPERAKVMWDHVVNIYTAEVDKYRSRLFLTRDSLVSLVVPFHVEYPIDGSLVGLQNNIRADAFVPMVPLVAEMKTGRPRRAHELALAGYSLALESQFEVPIDFGYLCYVTVDKGVFTTCRLVQVSDPLRNEFLETRDRAVEAIDNDLDPGMPKRCDDSCPFLNHCNSPGSTGAKG
ncbi:type I-A CRISPR-associated protein Cas4/Csa1 [Metallosphaera tengchongensis]|uniref:Type I-A CRISPR-associated protein Cas4/Csa1 n=1 Tax=Metallosphaera tengchongensis TaxID=1532350 RepID=A0A6N0NYZ2_9CREN|nr:type I-A CRISPR-associated protein Cas4/Csa1 [Metallosphaera tengchongensis]QKR00759.1 type I-A CRISPR-associated protein Cas4/Csa1 [Metallosphaera tengchongensis]